MMKHLWLVLVGVVAFSSAAEDWKCTCQPPGDKEVDCGTGCYTDASGGSPLTVFHPKRGWDPAEDFGTDWTLAGTKLTAKSGKWVCTMPSATRSCAAAAVANGTIGSCTTTNGGKCAVTCAAGYTPKSCSAGPTCIDGSWTPFSCIKQGRIRKGTDSEWQWFSGLVVSVPDFKQEYIGSYKFGPLCPSTCIQLKLAGGGSSANAGDKKRVLIKDIKTDKVYVDKTLATIFSGANVHQDSPRSVSFSGIPAGAEVYFEFVDSDNNAHGKTWAWIGFDPSSVGACSG